MDVDHFIITLFGWVKAVYKWRQNEKKKEEARERGGERKREREREEGIRIERRR